MNNFKKLIAKILIVSMILTSHSFFTFAEGIKESATIEETTVAETGTVESRNDIESSDNVELSENVESSENVVASSASPSDADDTEEDGEHTNSDDVEEPEEDETTVVGTTVEGTTTVEETTTSVGASSASPEETTTTEETTTIEETSDSVWVSEDVELGTLSEAMQIVEESIEESLLDDKATISEIIDQVIEEKIIDTKLNLSLATVSEMELLGDGNDTFWFGTYPQNDTSGLQLEPIPWRLIRLMDDGTAIFTSYPILSKGAWHGVEDPKVTWKNCDLRNWLNNDFIIKAFTTKQIISDLMVDREDVDQLDGSTYNIGKVFLLDLDTANTCFSSNEDRVAWPTAYAETLSDEGNNDWWLRTCYLSPYKTDRGWAYIVYRTGDTEERYVNMNINSNCVRPAICLKMDSSLYRPGNVTWNLGDSSFKAESRLWNDFNNYFGGQKLPTAINMMEQSGKEFKGWKINDGNVIYSEIPINQTGDITLTPVWENLSLRYFDRYFGTDLTTHFENYNPELVYRPSGKFPYLADYSQGEIFEDYYIEELLYRDAYGQFNPIPYNGEITIQNHIVYVVGSRGVLPPYFKTITDIQLILDDVTTKYKVGQKLNVSGLALMLTFANGEKLKIVYNEELSQFFTFYPNLEQILNTNNNEVLVKFGDLTVKYSIEVAKNNIPPSGGGSGGGGGGGGVIKAIQNTMFKDLPIMTTNIQTNKFSSGSVNMLSSKWIKNEFSGKWMLSSKVEDGRTWMLSNGFYDVVSYVNEKPVVDTYYFNEAGELVTGFVNTIDNNRYFFESEQSGNEGKMSKGWRLISNKWYYFGEDGAMYRYRMTPDGYFVDSNGEYIE